MNQKFTDIKYCIWDVDLTFYTVSPQMKKEFKNKIYEYLSQKLKIPIGEAKQKYEEELKKRKSKTATLEAFGLGKYAIQEVIDSIDKNRYLKKDPRLIQLFKNLKHYKHAIVTNSTKNSVNKTLKILGLKKSFFETIITKEDVNHYKPSPEPFIKIVEIFRTKAEKCVSIGDVDYSDIIPAKKLGMKTIFVWGKSKYADESVLTIYEVEKLLM
ncbi:MAG TPA: HAD family hydrolase [Patescibacteria group bacterium]|nr:HAD family hydrolase [Patescibacteria group bacterium]